MIDIVLCASGADEVRIVHGITHEQAGRARVIRRCADLAETLGAVAAGIGDVVLIDLTARGLDRDALREMMARSTPVVGLTHADAAGAPTTALGLRCTVGADAPVEQIMAQVALALSPGQDAAADWTQDIAPEPEPRARTVAVWGPVGAPGRSTVALNIAAEAAAEGIPTVLVDADTYGPSLAQLLGVIDDVPGLVAACRAASRDTLDDETLERLLPQVSGSLRLLSGIGAAARWAEIREGALDGVLAALARREGLVVIDAGFCLEEAEEVGYDTLAPRRNAATITTVTAADAVLAVATADPVSITRLLRERERLEELGVQAPHVVLNRSAHPAQAARLSELVAQRMELDDITVLPEDAATCRRAVQDGAVLAEAGRRTALRRALREIALGMSAPVAG